MDSARYEDDADSLIRAIANIIDPKAYDERLCEMKRPANVRRRQKKANEKAAAVLQEISRWAVLQ